MDTQTEAQRQKALLDAGLTPTQQAGVTAGTGYSINSSVLQPQPEIKIPTPPQDTNNYQSMISGGQATIDQYNKDVQKEMEDYQSSKSKTDSTPSLIEQYLNSSTAPTELTGQYQTAVAGLAPQEQAVTTENVALKSAQTKLRDVNARLAGINAEVQATPIQVEKEFTGRASVGQQEAMSRSRLRDIALRALPLQAEAIAAQAEVQTAQGNVELAQNTLKLAQDKLNTAFQLYTKDAENKYNYQKDLRDKVYAYATEKEKQKLDALQREDDRDFQFMRDQINNANDIAQEAMKAGQASLAARITALDPNSRSYVTDLAELQGQIIPKAETDIIKLDSGETVMIDKKTGNIIKSIRGAVSSPTSITSSVAENWLSQFNSGLMSIEDIYTKIGSSKESIPLKNEVARLIAQQGGKRVYGGDDATIQAINSQIKNVDDLLKGSKFSKIVGLIQGGAGLFPDIWNVGKQDALAIAKNLVSNQTLQALAEAKSKGITFGALSEKELGVVAESASRIAAKIKTNDKGEIIGFTGSQKQFKEDLEVVKNGLKKSVAGKTGAETFAQDEKDILDSAFGNTSPASYFK